jgi:GNAT superfamily N-acetyltransferase
MKKDLIYEWKRDEYFISTDRDRLDVAMIHKELAQSYWSKGIPIEIVRCSIENSFVFGLYHKDTQIGFARVITDNATFAYLADVFVVNRFRGQGLGKWLISVIVNCPDLQGLRRWLLATRNAHGLYQQFGFTALANPGIFMERNFPDVYQQAKNQFAIDGSPDS